MEYVKKCIQAMLDHGSDGLLLMTGKAPVLRIGGKARSLGSEVVTPAHLEAFLGGVPGQENAEAFSYGGASAPVTVRKVLNEGVLSLQVLPAAAKAPDPAPVAAAAPSAAPATLVEETPPPRRTGRIDELLTTMIKKGASDLHLCTGASPYLRLDGEMVELPKAPFSDRDLHAVLMEIIPDRNRLEFEQQSDTDFAYEIDGLARFRCNYFRDRKGCGAVFRQIPVEILTTEQLGLPDSLLRLCNLSKGLVLVTGPTGSGKSTTLAALIDHINKTRQDHIITIEDPIEFVHQNQKCLVNQREVNVHTMGFKQALRAALREDPDIVLVGEMRDLETISIAVETAETGHLVFGTLHTTTATSTIDRIIDQFPADQQGQIRVMLSESLRGVISQTLCKKKGGGRVAALEILLYSRAIGNLIREGKSFQIPSAIQTGRKEGMMLLNDSLMDLVNRDLITADEAYIRAVDKDGIQPLLQSRGLTIGV